MKLYQKLITYFIMGDVGVVVRAFLYNIRYRHHIAMFYNRYQLSLDEFIECL